MRRILRRLFRAAVAGFCLLSLLACLAAAGLRASGPSEWPLVRLGRAAGWYVTIRPGDVVLLRKPPPTGTPAEAEARAMLAATSNREIFWQILVFPSHTDEDATDQQ